MATTIQWTDQTVNPITGCTKISPGCDNCYAERVATTGLTKNKFPNGFKLSFHLNRLAQFSKTKRSQRIFVGSMTDIFQKDVPHDAIGQIFDAMEANPQHRFQILTKRSSLMRDWINARYPDGVPAHIWLGVSVEDQQRTSRIHHLRQTNVSNAGVRFLSIEPLLGPLKPLDLTGIHWVIVGGESGSGYRPMDLDWVRPIRDQCVDLAIPFLYKQGSAYRSGQHRELDGREWNQFPDEPLEDDCLLAAD